MLHGLRVAEGHGLLEEGPLLGRVLAAPGTEGPPPEGGAASPGRRVAVVLKEALEVAGHGVAGVPVVDVEHQAGAAHGHCAHGQQGGQVDGCNVTWSWWISVVRIRWVRMS